MPSSIVEIPAPSLALTLELHAEVFEMISENAIAAAHRTRDHRARLRYGEAAFLALAEAMKLRDQAEGLLA